MLKYYLSLFGADGGYRDCCNACLLVAMVDGLSFAIRRVVGELALPLCFCWRWGTFCSYSALNCWPGVLGGCFSCSQKGSEGRRPADLAPSGTRLCGTKK
jgi:hypothetical protein